jgi:dolichyl-phosphate-mannose-protein mannosyltransferase
MAKPSKASSQTSSNVSRAQSTQTTNKKHRDYTSEGVRDHDILLLPASDYQALILVTFLGAVVRLFRIYQPSSVVFDEVQ